MTQRLFLRKGARTTSTTWLPGQSDQWLKRLGLNTVMMIFRSVTCSAAEQQTPKRETEKQGGGALDRSSWAPGPPGPPTWWQHHDKSASMSWLRVFTFNPTITVSKKLIGHVFYTETHRNQYWWLVGMGPWCSSSSSWESVSASNMLNYSNVRIGQCAAYSRLV